MAGSTLIFPAVSDNTQLGSNQTAFSAMFIWLEYKGNTWGFLMNST